MTKFKDGNPCKRCGGRKRYISGHCTACKAGYGAINYKSSAIGIRRAGDSGYAGELVVRVDLLMRGLDVTVPENRCAPDDVHFRSSEGWISVQVKVSTVHAKTGTWYTQLRGRGRVTSDILAWVDLRSKTIRYQPNTKPVPPELLGDNNA